MAKRTKRNAQLTRSFNAASKRYREKYQVGGTVPELNLSNRANIAGASVDTISNPQQMIRAANSGYQSSSRNTNFTQGSLTKYDSKRYITPSGQGYNVTADSTAGSLPVDYYVPFTDKISGNVRQTPLVSEPVFNEYFPNTEKQSTSPVGYKNLGTFPKGGTVPKYGLGTYGTAEAIEPISFGGFETNATANMNATVNANAQQSINRGNELYNTVSGQQQQTNLSGVAGGVSAGLSAVSTIGNALDTTTQNPAIPDNEFDMWDDTWDDVSTGMSIGATTGAAIGSFIPVIGNVVGGAIGGVVGGISGLVTDLFQNSGEEEEFNLEQDEIEKQRIVAARGEPTPLTNYAPTTTYAKGGTIDEPRKSIIDPIKDINPNEDRQAAFYQNWLNQRRGQLTENMQYSKTGRPLNALYHNVTGKDREFVSEEFYRQKNNIDSASYYAVKPSPNEETGVTPSGVYYPSDNEIQVDPKYDNTTTEVHERTHSAKAYPQQAKIKDLTDKGKIGGETKFKDTYTEKSAEYLSDPDEIYSRVMELRYDSNIDPNVDPTKEDIEKYRKSNSGRKGPSYNDLFDMYDNDELEIILREVAEKAPQQKNDTMIAAYGGVSTKPNAELETKEVFRTPDGSIEKVPEGTPTHAQGGVKMTLPEGTEILGKMKGKNTDGKRYKDLGQNLKKRFDKYENAVAQSSNPLSKRTAERMLDKVQVEFDALMNAQETQQGMNSQFPADYPNPKGQTPQENVAKFNPEFVDDPQNQGSMIPNPYQPDGRFAKGGRIPKFIEGGTVKDTDYYKYAVSGDITKADIDDFITNYKGKGNYSKSAADIETLITRYKNNEVKGKEGTGKEDWITMSSLLAHKRAISPDYRLPGKETVDKTFVEQRFNEAKPPTTMQTPRVSTEGLINNSNLIGPTSTFEDARVNRGIEDYRAGQQQGGNAPASNPWWSTAAQLAPAAYNMGQGLFGKEDYLSAGDFQNPYAGQIRSELSDRQYNIRPQLEMNELAYQTGKRNIRQMSPGVGGYLSNVGALSGTRMRADSQAWAQKQNMENQWRGQNASVLGQLGAQSAQTDMNVAQYNAQVDAAKQGAFSTSVDQLGSAAFQMASTRNKQYNEGLTRDALIAYYTGQSNINLG